MSNINSLTEFEFLTFVQGMSELLAIVKKSVELTISGYSKTVVKAGTPGLQKTPDRSKTAIGSLIRYDSEKIVLELFLSFEKELAARLYENTFAEPPEDIELTQDLVGEYLNITFGYMDPQLRPTGIKMKSSFPQNFSGPPLLSLISRLSANSLVIPFQAQTQEKNNQFTLEIFAPGLLNQTWGYSGGK